MSPSCGKVAVFQALNHPGKDVLDMCALPLVMRQNNELQAIENLPGVSHWQKAKAGPWCWPEWKNCLLERSFTGLQKFTRPPCRAWQDQDCRVMYNSHLLATPKPKDRLSGQRSTLSLFSMCPHQINLPFLLFTLRCQLIESRLLNLACQDCPAGGSNHSRSQNSLLPPGLCQT